jgi:hypothetical protein
MRKRRSEIRQVRIKKVSDKLTDVSVEKQTDGVESGVSLLLHDKSGGYLSTAQVAPGV